MIAQFAAGATSLMAMFLVLSSLAMLVAILASSLVTFSVRIAGASSSTVDAGLAALAFFLSKLWMASRLQMLALYNGIGGGAASAIATVEMLGNKAEGATRLAVTLIGAVIGAASLSGSLIAWTKLDGVIPERGSRQTLSQVLGAAALVIGGCIVIELRGIAAATPGLIYGLLGCALLFGALITLPIRRAHMPVVISTYNACTGLAIGLEGFMLRSPALMIVGLVIGAARVFMTLLMAKC